MSSFRSAGLSSTGATSGTYPSNGANVHDAHTRIRARAAEAAGAQSLLMTENSTPKGSVTLAMRP